MKVTVFVEDSVQEGFSADYGLSFFIEHDGMDYLLDGGGSEDFAENAAKLGVDLLCVDVSFLSHVHYDHLDGFPKFFEINNHTLLYLRSSCAENNCYVIHDGEQIRAGFTPELTVKYADRLKLT